MATLRRESDGARWPVPGHCLVGRSPAATLRLNDGRVSHEHARITFTEGTWRIQDEGSRNGTHLEGRRLAPAEAIPLALGARIVFGRRDVVFLVEDLAPPTPMATELDSGDFVVAVDGVLVLPDEVDARICLFATLDGHLAEVDGEVRPVLNGRLLELGTRAWRLHLPEPPAFHPLDTLQLTVGGSAELVTVTITTPAGRFDLPPRGHHALLRTLVEARLGRPTEGWLAEAALGARLALDLIAIRRELCGLGISGAVIERHRREVRLALAPAQVTFR